METIDRTEHFNVHIKKESFLTKYSARHHNIQELEDYAQEVIKTFPTAGYGTQFSIKYVAGTNKYQLNISRANNCD